MSLFIAAAVLAGVSSSALAAPPEVTGLMFASNDAAQWDFLAGARGYNVYRSTLDRVRAGDYGDCLVGSHRSTSVTNVDGTAPGVVDLFLVAAFDEDGHGTLGFTSAGVERAVPPNPCKPARRHFDFTVNGDPGDGVLDGVEPARNAAASLYATGGEGTGVYLHSGEFFVTATDLAWQERFPGGNWPGSRIAGALQPGSYYHLAWIMVSPPRINPIIPAIDIPADLAESRDRNEPANIGALRVTAPMAVDFSFGVANPTTIGSATGGAGAGKVEFNEFTIKKVSDTSIHGTTIPSLLGSRMSANEASASSALKKPTTAQALPRPGSGTGSSTPVTEFFLVRPCPTIEECYTYLQNEQCSEFYACFDEWRECTGSVMLGPVCVPIDSYGPIEPDEPIELLIWLSVYQNLFPGSQQNQSPRFHLRLYRSQVSYNGPLGHGWDFPANARLVPAAGDVLHHDGTGRADLYLRTSPISFGSPPGIYSVLVQNLDNSFTLRDPDGTLHDFHGFDGTSLEGAVEKVTDRNGNFTSLLYDQQGLLTTLVDTMGRSIGYAYDALGRIASITDFTGRQVQYGYDANGDLVSVRSPVVTGTPNGNDFPSGKMTKYTYSSGFAVESLNHNLTGIIRPNEEFSGTPAVQIAYGMGAGEFDFDRVTTQTIGGTNASGVPAGGSLSFSFAPMNAGFPPDPITPRRQATVLDRNGNGKEFVLNHAGNLLSRTDFTNRDLRPGEPDYTATHSYNPDGEMTEAILPEGNSVRFTYDSASPNRGSQGNLLEIRAIPDNPGAGGGSGRGDGHGGILAVRAWTFTHEPIFNRLLSLTDPRGNDSAYVPPNGGAQSAARYTMNWTCDFQEGDPAANGIESLAARFGIDLGGTPVNLGDRNGDGVISQARGNIVRGEAPSVLLDPASNQAVIEGDTSQEVVALYEWNDLGQPTAATDPERNRHEFGYFPETDPDGDGVMIPIPDDDRILNAATGGYLRTARLDTTAAPGRSNGTDPPPTMIQHDFQYDDVGNVTGVVDGRGVLTRLIVNALNQVVEVRRAAATADLSGPDGDPPTGRGEASGINPRVVPAGFKTRYSYDANDNVVRVDVEDRGATRGIGPFVETIFAYDLLDNLLQMSRETTPTANLATRFLYDPNENLIQVMQPEGNAHTRAWDERDLLLSRTAGESGPRGGVPAVHRYDYDGNRTLTRFTDANGGLFDVAYDGFDRAARATDQIGTTADWFYDPASRPVRSLRRGPVGGPAPADRSGSTNIDLADTRFLYDELGRLFRADRSLFVPAGATPARPPILAEGPLVPADGAVNTVLEHDRLSRLTFAVRDSGATTRYDYDGAGRRVRTTLPQGVEILELTYDAGHNLVETVEREFTVIGAGAAIEERFFTTAIHDALGRAEIVVDNIGQTRRLVYDSLDSVVAASDARGPAGGTINRRSPGNELLSVPINAHGNVTSFTYDGAGMRQTAQQVLTPSGIGDGTRYPIPDTSNPFNLDGLITVTTVWDRNSLPVRSVDDRGNETAYAYDNLNRSTLWTGDDGTMYAYGYDPAGNVVGVTDAKGSMFTHTHDPAHRVVSVAVVPAPGVEGTTDQTFEYDGLGRLTRVTDANDPPEPNDDVTVDFIHDSLSRLVEEGQQIGPSGSPVLTTDYGWLAGTLMTNLIYPDGRNIRYGYDGADRLVSIGDLDRTRTEGATYQYFGLGRVHTRTYAGGPVSTRMNDAGDMDIGFDGARRTKLLRHRDPAAGTVLAGFEYRYDRESSPTSHRRLHHADALGNLKGEVYGHDSAGRLLFFQESFLDANHVGEPLPNDQIDWMLDGTSSWPEMTRNRVTYLATPNNMNEYGEPKSGGVAADDGVPDDFHDDASTPEPDGLNFANDENGDLTFDGRHDLFFDPLGRIVRAVRASDRMEVARYTYDALGRRATRIVTNSGPLDGSTSYRYGSASGEYSPAEIQASTLFHEMMPSIDGVRDWWGDSFMVSPRSGWGGRTIEEGSGGGAPVRQIVYGKGRALWQIHNSGPSEYFLEDPFGSTVALFSVGGGPGGGGVVERVTYDPYGKPVLESAANVPLMDAARNFVPQSQYGNTQLWLGMEYDPELGERTADPNTDWGGLYAAGSEWKYTPVGRFALFLEGSLHHGTEWAVFEPDEGPGRTRRRIASRFFLYYSPNLGRFLTRHPNSVQVMPGKAQTASG